MGMPLSHVFIIASLFSAAFGNIVSPGLEKCLDLKAKLVDGKRQTLEDMEKESVINVQLYACHNKHNQEFEIVGSAIKSKSLKKCLAAAGKKEDTTQNVELAVCDESENQKWDLIAENYAVHKASGKCMDVQALKVGDAYEKWDQIKAHKVVNQLWEWAVVRNAKIGLWEMQDVASC